MKSSGSSRKKKWKYSDHAEKKRFCSECKTKLDKDEAMLCTSCFDELLNKELGNNGEDKNEVY